MGNALPGAVLRHAQRRLVALDAAERTDRQLLDDFLTGTDPGAFEVLVRRHGPMVLRVCRHVLRQQQDAEDAFQATFLALAQNAALIRKRESLASWLHGVARRVAMRARRDAGRRRTHESRAQATPRTAPPGEADWQEMQAILDEEIGRLPETYRAPFVLCCLEGRGRAEAARELGLQEGTVWSRLARARKQLLERLARRGISLSAVLGAAALVEGTATAVPPALVASTVRAVLSVAGGTVVVSARVAALAKGATKAMFLSNLKTATALCLLAAGAIAAGGVLLGAEAAPPARPNGAATNAGSVSPDQPAPKGPEAAPPKGALREKGETVEVNARVLDPDGKPVAAAEVTLWWHFGYWGYYRSWHPTTGAALKHKVVATSGEDGGFQFRFAKTEVDENPLNMWEGSWTSVCVVASAKGYGPAWASLKGLDTRDLTLRLVKDDVPVRGRVLDLQGKPVAGARVGVECVRIGGDEFNSLWQPVWAGLPENLTTDKDGRFTLSGVGRDRTVVLHVSGSTIEHQIVSVSTQDAASARVEVIAGPTKPIEGVVRAKDTGKPLAGVVVYGGEQTYHRRVRAVTDDRGRYRLVGLPKAGSYELTVYAPVNLGYLGTLTRPGDTEGLRPITADIELRRGIELRCRLIDKDTRQPMRGVLHYTVLATNPHYREAERAVGLVPTREFERVHVPDSNGIFQLVVYPGPGLLLANLQGNVLKYLPVRLDPADRDKARGDHQMGFANLGWPYRLIDPKASDGLLAIDIELDPGRTVKGKLVGPDGKPVKGATPHGLNHHPHLPTAVNPTLGDDTFTATLLEVDRPRTVSFIHANRKLVGHVVLRGDEKGPVTVRLEPWGSLTGRLVDADGKPVPGARLEWRYPSLPEPGVRPPDKAITTDREGHFRVEGLLPGAKFELVVSDPEKKVTFSAGDALKGLVVESDKVKELGDVRVKATPADKK